MNKHIICLFFCFSMHMQACDSSGDDNQHEHAIDIQRISENMVAGAPQERALVDIQSTIDTAGACCSKTFVGCLTLGTICFFPLLFITFYNDCGKFNTEAVKYEHAFFSFLTNKEYWCTFRLPIDRNFTDYEYIRCVNYDIVDAFVFYVNLNLTMQYYGLPLSIEKEVMGKIGREYAYYKFPQSCKKYIDYDVLCKKAHALQKADLCKATQVNQKKYFPKKRSCYKKIALR